MLTKEFKRIRSLGEGGFGTTTLVERDGQRYVLKRLKPSVIADHGQTAIDLFLKESEYLRQLGDHPQIPALIDSGVDADGPWLLQEYIPGENLDQSLGKKLSLSEAEIISLLKSLLPVLKFIHDHRTIHRDVKPANIILYQERYYLVDFGASKHVSETVLRKTGTTIGSAGYAAPEQMFGKAGFSSDVFSLGVTCIHLLTGIQPFDLFDMSIGGWNWRGSLPKDKCVSEGLGLILDKMLDSGTKGRYQSADEVTEALKNIDKWEIERQRIERQRIVQKNKDRDRRNRLAIKWVRRVAMGGGVAAIVVVGGYGVSQLVHMIHLPELQMPEVKLPKEDPKNSLPAPVGTIVNLIKILSYPFLASAIYMSYCKYKMEDESVLPPLLGGGAFFILSNFVFPQILGYVAESLGQQ
jgi:serine/threonine protein kinase